MVTIVPGWYFAGAQCPSVDAASASGDSWACGVTELIRAPSGTFRSESARSAIYLR